MNGLGSFRSTERPRHVILSKVEGSRRATSRPGIGIQSVENTRELLRSTRPRVHTRTQPGRSTRPADSKTTLSVSTSAAVVLQFFPANFAGMSDKPTNKCRDAVAFLIEFE